MLTQQMELHCHFKLFMHRHSENNRFFKVCIMALRSSTGKNKYMV